MKVSLVPAGLLLVAASLPTRADSIAYSGSIVTYTVPANGTTKSLPLAPAAAPA